MRYTPGNSGRPAMKDRMSNLEIVAKTAQIQCNFTENGMKHRLVQTSGLGIVAAAMVTVIQHEAIRQGMVRTMGKPEYPGL